ncbi:Fe(3+) ions import ATP-binding protein FbpC 2, partial [Haemophilus influenzae]
KRCSKHFAKAVLPQFSLLTTVMNPYATLIKSPLFSKVKFYKSIRHAPFIGRLIILKQQNLWGKVLFCLQIYSMKIPLNAN